MDRGLRLLHVLPSIAPETGGPSFSVSMMCQALAQAGNEVSLFTTDWPRKMDFLQIPEKRVERNITIHLFPTRRNYLVGHLPDSPKLIEALHAAARNFDFVLVHSLWNPIATYAAKTLRHLGMTYGIMDHGMLDPLVLRRNPWKKIPWMYLYERENIRKARLLVFSSEKGKRKALCSGLTFQRTFIFPHIIDVASWKDLPPRWVFEELFPQVRGREIILFVGRINWVKNLDQLILAFRLLKSNYPKAMLVLAGPDNEGYKRKLIDQAKTLAVAGDLLFTGMLDRENLKSAYSRADVFALISQKENFGLSLAEALAWGIPSVISEGVDIGSTLGNEKCLCVVKPDSSEIASALEAMLERSARVGVPDPEARALAEREWGRPKVWELLQTYREILGRSS